MLSKLKYLGLALAAVLAFSAVGSSSASAANEFHCETSHCILTWSAETNQVWTTEAGTMTCTAFSGSGTNTTATAMQLTVETVSLTGCKTKTIFGEIAMTVSFNGCDYLYTTSTEAVHLICPAGKEVTITGPGCTITVPGGQTLNQVHYFNQGVGTTRDLKIEKTITKTKSTASGAFCSKNGTFENGTEVGNLTITGEETNKVHEAFWYE